MSDHGGAAEAIGPRGAGDVLREIGSGASAAFVLIALMLPMGLVAFAPLGFSSSGEFDPVAINAGVRGAFAAAMFGALTAAVFGGAVLPNEVPRASTVFVFAAFITRLAMDQSLRSLPAAGVPQILFLAAFCLALSGVVQILFGVLKLGNIARFVPYPVVAGLMSGLAIMLVIYEAPEVLGLHVKTDGDGHGGLQWWMLLVGVVTIIVAVGVGRKWPRMPARLIAIAAGTLLAFSISRLVPGAELGPHVPDLGGRIPLPDALAKIFEAEGTALLFRYKYDLLITAAAIAVVGSLDSLLAAVGESEGPIDQEHKPNRLLIALGCGNLVSAAFGGVPVAYSSHHALLTHAGQRKTLPAAVTAATLFLLLLYGAPLLEMIPIAVLSGMMLVIAVSLIDRWAGSTFARLRAGQYDQELLLNLFVVVTVATVTVVFGLVAAVVVGVILSMALFIAVMNRSLVRAVDSGVTRMSRRVYPPEQASLLRLQGHRTKLLELDGAIFFGTADRLAAEATPVAKGARYLILDLRRVTMIDASGALMLDRLSRRLREQKSLLLLAGVSADNRLGRALVSAGVFTGKHHPDWFEDADRALEWTERQWLAEATFPATHRELAIHEFALTAGLSADELAMVKPYLDRQLFTARAALYHEGQRGDRLFVLARGNVSIVAEDPTAPGKPRRIVTLAPGVIFGESAVLEDGVRSVTAVAEDEIVTYSLSRTSLEEIRGINPELYRKLILNLVAHLAGLLRMATGILRDNREAGQ